MADASQNNPTKELMYALVGIVAFLAIVLLIGISAYLRPAGNHIVPEVESEDVAANEETVVEETPAEADVVAVAEATDAEPDMSAEESIAANLDADDTLAATQPTSGNVSSDDVVVADNMSVGGEGAAAPVTEAVAADETATESTDAEETTTETAQ